MTRVARGRVWIVDRWTAPRVREAARWAVHSRCGPACDDLVVGGGVAALGVVSLRRRWLLNDSPAAPGGAPHPVSRTRPPPAARGAELWWGLCDGSAGARSARWCSARRCLRAQRGHTRDSRPRGRARAAGLHTHARTAHRCATTRRTVAADLWLPGPNTPTRCSRDQRKLLALMENRPDGQTIAPQLSNSRAAHAGSEPCTSSAKSPRRWNAVSAVLRRQGLRVMLHVAAKRSRRRHPFR